MTNQETVSQKDSLEELSPNGAIPAPVPDHLRAPNGVGQNVHDINLALTALLLEAEAGYRWLNRPLPDADAAKLTFSRLLVHAQRVDVLVRDLLANKSSDG